MPTEKLYWQDPFATAFAAPAARLSRFGDRPSVVLDRTLFYPEAGGQLADQGSLVIGALTVTVDDVQVDDDGAIHHLCAGLAADATLEGRVEGRIDAARRRDHMAQHTAQHMLSRALVDVAKAETVSARLGASVCTIDVGVADIAEADLLRAEDLVNAVAMDDVPVRQHFPTPEELAKMPLRRPPKVDRGIRVIEVEGFDFSPCGGTHCTRSGQIGTVRIAGVERYKGGLRVKFHAARRAIDDARKKERVLAELAHDFTCGATDVPNAIGKLRAELQARTLALANARGELVGLVAERAWREHPPQPGGTTVIALLRERDDVATLRTLAGRLASRADVVAVCASPDPDSGDLAIVVQRGEGVGFDCGAWLKAAAAAHQGRGGGRAERAEGRLGHDALANWSSIIDALGATDARRTKGPDPGGEER